jgi:glycosyltransferase involved in cell wall biosynthesis
MKLAVYHNQPSGGARRALHELGKQLSRRHRLDVYTLETGDESSLSSRDFATELTVLPYRLRRPIRLGLYLNDVRRLLDLWTLEDVSREAAARIDAVGYDAALVDACQFVLAPSVLNYLATPSAYYCHHPPRRFIDSICRPEAAPLTLYERARHWWHLPGTKLYDSATERLDRRNVQKASVVLCNSQHTRGVIRDYYGLDTEVCYLGVDSERFRPGDSDTTEPYVLSVGAFEPHKGFDFLVRSLARCPAASRPRLVAVGNTDTAGVSRDIHRLAEELGVQVDILVGLNTEQLIPLYQRARVFVYAAHQEPFGLVVLEAMACGLPVVAVAEAGPCEIVTEGETGFLAPRDEDAFAARVAQIVSDPGLARSLGREGRARVERDWTWEAAAERVESRLLRLSRATEKVA